MTLINPETSSDDEGQPGPCQCHESFAYIAPLHPGHCCFWPGLQKCHPEEVAAWERERGVWLSVIAREGAR